MSLILPIFDFFLDNTYLSYIFILSILALFIKGLIRL